MERNKFASAASAAFAALLMVACQPSVGPASADSDEPAPASLESAAKQTLSNLPELKLTLPQSLSLQAEAAAASLRALGDTTELTADMLPGLKSEAWYDLQSSGSNSFLKIINGAFSYIKSYAAANDVPVDAVFTIPVGDEELVEYFGMPDAYRNNFTVTARLKIQGDSETAFSIFGRYTFSGTMYGIQLSVTADTRFDVAYDGADSRMDMYFNMVQSQTYNSQTRSQSSPLYAFYDSKTGTCRMASDYMVDEDGTPLRRAYVQESVVGADGSVSTVNMDLENGVPRYLHVAYGNDAAGGIASMNSWTDDSDGLSYDYFWGEYYDENGELLRRDNGESRIWVPVYDESRYANLKDLGYAVPPETLSVRSHWETTEGSHYYIKERKADDGSWVNSSRASYTPPAYEWSYEEWDGSSWVASDANTNGLAFMFKADPAEGVWTAGDTVYYWQGDSYYEADGIYYAQYELYQGYVVPVPLERFGKNYWMRFEYPLKRVLPLSPSYAAKYSLIQEEGDTYSSTWTDEDGNEEDWSYTQYSYYLNRNERDIDGDGVADAEDPIRFEESFDVELSNLSQYDMYYWNGTDFDKKRAYFVGTTGALPDYFSAPSTDLISGVDAQLSALMDRAYSLGVEEYLEKIEEAKTAADGVF